MIAVRAPSLGWGALFLSGAAATLLPPVWQAAYAAGVIAVLGLPHGAADLALVPAARRSAFRAAYGVAIVATVLLWRADPAMALTGFLLLSLLHFAMDGQGGIASTRSWAVAATLLCGPALFHRSDLISILATLAADDAARRIAATLFAIGIAAVPVALVLTIREAGADPSLWIEVAALLFVAAAAPLVGFALGFVALHADRQTRLRRDALGAAGYSGYLRRVLPVLLATVPVILLLAAFVPASPGGIRLLFVAMSALAVPHMLVTPLWTGEAGAAVTRLSARGRARPPAWHRQPSRG